MRRTSQHLAGPAGQMAFCGLTAALAVVIMAVGTWVPAATFCCPVLASLALIPVLERVGTRLSLVWYAAVALLSLLLASDKEAALVFLLLGWYPVAQPRLNRLRLAWLVKLALFQGVLAVYTAVLLWVLTDGSLSEGAVLLAVTWVLANLVFVLYDRVLARLTVRWRRSFGRS